MFLVLDCLPILSYAMFRQYTQFGQVVAALFATDCFMCTVVQNHDTVYTNIITWPKNGHMLPTGQRYSLQVVKQVLHGIAYVR